MTKLYAGAAVAALVAVVGGTYAYTVLWTEAACGGSTVAGGAAAIGGPFELVNGEGATLTDADVIDGPTLIYFGYTFCPDVCPMDVARNALAIDLLDDMGHDVTPVFISIDPARDTPDVVGEYAGYMHPKMIGLTGSPEQVKAASKAYKTYYRAHDSEDDFYLVDHSTFTYLMFPATGFATHFNRDASPEEIAERTACHIANV